MVVGDEIIPGSSYNWIMVRAHSMVSCARIPVGWGTCPQFEIPDSVLASDAISMMDGFALN